MCKGDALEKDGCFREKNHFKDARHFVARIYTEIR